MVRPIRMVASASRVAAGVWAKCSASYSRSSRRYPSYVVGSPRRPISSPNLVVIRAIATSSWGCRSRQPYSRIHSTGPTIVVART